MKSQGTKEEALKNKLSLDRKSIRQGLAAHCFRDPCILLLMTAPRPLRSVVPAFAAFLTCEGYLFAPAGQKMSFGCGQITRASPSRSQTLWKAHKVRGRQAVDSSGPAADIDRRRQGLLSPGCFFYRTFRLPNVLSGADFKSGGFFVRRTFCLPDF